MASKPTNFQECNKFGFKSERKATEAMEKINENPRKGQKTLLKNVYKCEVCKSWHLSSMLATTAVSISKSKIAREAIKKPSTNTVEKRIEFLKNAYKKKNKFNL